MSPALTIMIPTLLKREKFFNRLMVELNFQIERLDNPKDVEILPHLDSGELSTGLKRNWCVHNAKGIYVAFHDDDDMPTDCYIRKQLEVAKSGADCGYLKGLYFENGVYFQPFLHSIQYKEWYQDKSFYYRCPNHLNAIKRDLILDIPYQDKVVGEDGNFSMDLMRSGRLKTEYLMKETIYLYYAVTKK